MYQRKMSIEESSNLNAVAKCGFSKREKGVANKNDVNVEVQD